MTTGGERRELGYYRALHLAAKAMGRKGSHRVGPYHWRWDVHCRCSSPVGVVEGGSILGPDDENRFIQVDMTVRCRKCPNCLKVRGWEWTQRARAEIGFWPRTYFGTLTLSPEEQYRAICEATTELAEEGLKFGTAAVDEQFKYRCMVIGGWITDYLKRVRKELGVALRYLLVAEAHKSGDPHFHLLVHEVEGASFDAWDTYCVLKTQWPHGHCAWNGIGHDPRASRYVTKYISKSALARVRASKRYGEPQASGLAIWSNPKTEDHGHAVLTSPPEGPDSPH